MKTRIPKRVYTGQFREAAVRQVIEAGRSSSEVARLRLDNEILERAAAYFARESR